jgi:hypothetical protein
LHSQQPPSQLPNKAKAVVVAVLTPQPDDRQLLGGTILPCLRLFAGYTISTVPSDRLWLLLDLYAAVPHAVPVLTLSTPRMTRVILRSTLSAPPPTAAVRRLLQI